MPNWNQAFEKLKPKVLLVHTETVYHDQHWSVVKKTYFTICCEDRHSPSFGLRWEKYTFICSISGAASAIKCIYLVVSCNILLFKCPLFKHEPKHEREKFSFKACVCPLWGKVLQKDFGLENSCSLLHFSKWIVDGGKVQIFLKAYIPLWANTVSLCSFSECYWCL